MLQLINFEFVHSDGQKIISKTNLTINKGEKIALLGNNGVGKSSVLNGIWENFIINNGSVIGGNNFAYLPQHTPELDFPINKIKDLPSYYQLFYDWDLLQNQDKSVYENYQSNMFYWLLNGLVDKNFVKKLDENIFDLKLSTGFMATSFNLLSPGTKKKLMLAILFATNPDFILIDELTNHLDLEAINTVSGWIKKSNAGFLVVDHNSSFLQDNFNNFLFLPNNEERKLEFHAHTTFDNFITKHFETVEKQKLAVKGLERKEKKLQEQLKLVQYRAEVFNADVGAQSSNIRKKLKREIEENEVYKNMDLRKNVKFATNLEKAKVKESCLVSVKDLEYRIGQNLLQHVKEFKIYGGTKIWLKGKNGMGKSSLINLILDASNNTLQKNDQYINGQIIINEKLKSENIYVLRQNVSYGQGETIEHFVLKTHKLEWFEINKLLQNCGLAEKFTFESNLSHLSLGEFVRFQLSLLANKLNTIKLILLDEPGNFLDVFTQSALTDLMKKYKGAVLFITHDQNLGNKFEADEVFEVC